MSVFFPRMLGFTLKPNQTFGSIFKLCHWHDNQSPNQSTLSCVYDWQSFRGSVLASGFCWQCHSKLKHTSPLVVNRCYNAVDGQQQVRPGTFFKILGLAGTRPVTTPPNNTNWLCHWLDVTAGDCPVENCWITHGWLSKAECQMAFKTLPVNSGPGVWTVP